MSPNAKHPPSTLNPASKAERKENIVKSGIQKKRRNDQLFDLICRGDLKQIPLIEDIIKEDPANNLYEEDDPRHILNRPNQNGLTPLYLACQSGNLNMVSFLVELGAAVQISSQLSHKQWESNLEVAARWNFPNIVVFLMKMRKWNRRQLSRARMSSHNKEIRALLYGESRKLQRKANKSCCSVG